MTKFSACDAAAAVRPMVLPDSTRSAFQLEDQLRLDEPDDNASLEDRGRFATDCRAEPGSCSRSTPGNMGHRGENFGSLVRISTPTKSAGSMLGRMG